MNRYMYRVWGYLKSSFKYIILYGAIAAVFALILYLQDVRTDGVVYATVLTGTLLAACGVIDFLAYLGKCKKMEQISVAVTAELGEFPKAADAVEGEYQRMIQSLYDDKIMLESQMRISRQDMIDYYTLWVHQIKTPISAMHVLIQSAEKSRTDNNTWEDSCQEMDYLREMRIELFKTEQYADMVLSYLRMEEIGKDFLFREIPVGKIVRQAVRKYSQIFIARRIGIEIGELEEKIVTDEKWVGFVIEQILSNSLKYTKEGVIKIYMDGRTLVIEDSGIGIHPEDLPRVFERGFTGYNGRVERKSTGLGLYLCKNVMERLGHNISIDSTLNTGTKVYMYLGRRMIDFQE